MTKILVLYYSSYGHIETMALAVAEGVREAGADVVVKRVPELVPAEIAKKSGYKMDQAAPVATIDELATYDAIIIGTPTRYGNMTAQMKNFLDQTGGLWLEHKLVGKVGSVFTSTGSQHGGQETTIQSTHTVLLHLGMVIVGLPYSFKGQMRMDEITGARHMVPRRWPAKANANQVRTNSKVHGFKTGMLHKSQRGLRTHCVRKDRMVRIRRRFGLGTSHPRILPNH